MYKNSKLGRYIGLPSLILLCIGAVCGVIYCLYRVSPQTAELFNTCISPFFRFVFTNVSNVVPFSITEAALFFSPVIVVYLFMTLVRRAKKHDRSEIRLVCSVLALGAFVFSTFVLVYSPAYFAKGIDERMRLNTANITSDELKEVYARITDEINLLCEENDFFRTKDNGTYMPCDIWETADMISDAYEKAGGEYPFIQNMKTVVKPIILSPLMTYTHISGIYSFYTGEVNINTNYPDYIVTSTTAHEMAHQRGFAREDEANFIAFLVLVNSDDAYLKYSGYLDVYSTIGNALYKTDKEGYKEIRQKLCTEAEWELEAYSRFFDKFRDSEASKVSTAINNAYLQSQGTEGTVSYDMVTELVVAYYRK